MWPTPPLFSSWWLAEEIPRPLPSFVHESKCGKSNAWDVTATDHRTSARSHGQYGWGGRLRMSQSVVVVFIIMSEARLSCQSGLLGFVVWDTTQGLVWTTREGTVNAALQGKRCFWYKQAETKLQNNENNSVKAHRKRAARPLVASTAIKVHRQLILPLIK